MSENNTPQYDRLDSNGLLYFLQRIKTIFTGMFQAKETGKGLSTNDYTSAEKQKLAGIAEGATANAGTVTGITMNDTAQTVDANGNVDLGTVITAHQSLSSYAKKASPTFTGTPKAPTADAGTNTTQIATTAFVATAISNALSGKIDLHFEFLQELPLTGVVGTFYFIPATVEESGVDEWEEYVWNATDSQFERIGAATLDLTNYFNTTNLPAITNAQIDTILATPDT